jgi:VCBS repeat protein/FG-GAP repeat protein
VRYGAGDGTFPVRDTFTVGSYPTDVAIADLDGNGRNDLIVATPGSGSISVLLADAVGRLGTAVQYPTVGGVSSIAVGDFDGDGLLDVVGAGGNSLEILRGGPAGTFGPPTVIGSFPGVVSVSARDLDLDGHVDLVVSPGYSNGATILRGLGDGTFGPPEVYGTGVGPYRVAIRDLSGDGVPDIAVPNAYSQTVSVLVNLTVPTAPLDVPPSVRRVARLDLAVSPNPIRDAATMSVRLVSAIGARLEVLDITGRRVWERPLDGLRPGVHDVAWTRAGVAPGIYVVRLTEDGASVARRIAVVR